MAVIPPLIAGALGVPATHQASVCGPYGTAVVPRVFHYSADDAFDPTAQADLGPSLMPSLA